MAPLMACFATEWEVGCLERPITAVDVIIGSSQSFARRDGFLFFLRPTRKCIANVLGNHRSEKWKKS